MYLCVAYIWSRRDHAELVAVYCNNEVTAAAATNWDRINGNKEK